MATWLMSNFIWLATLLAVVLIGAKVLIARFLKKLMDDSANQNQQQPTVVKETK